MMRHFFGRLALFLFWAYLAVFPGSTIVVALNRVPEWGMWMGSALLLLQSAVALCWLIGAYGARGGLAALLIVLLAWAVEYVGVLTGIPFGRYRYTDALQPQIFGTVPLAIPCAWLMVATGAWQLAKTNVQTFKQPALSLSKGSNVQTLVLTATLVLLLDLQIETVATKVNQYWIWLDTGPYYGVPTTNFAAWWLVGLAMAFLVQRVLPVVNVQTFQRSNVPTFRSSIHTYLPAYLYLLSTLMFAIVNLARGYTIAGLVGVMVLLAAGLMARPAVARQAFWKGVEQAESAE